MPPAGFLLPRRSRARKHSHNLVCQIDGAALSTLLGVGSELASPNRGIDSGDQTIIIATGRSAQDSANQVGQQLTRRNMNVQPTLTVRPGFPVRVLVSKDLVLRPYNTRSGGSR